MPTVRELAKPFVSTVHPVAAWAAIAYLSAVTLLPTVLLAQTPPPFDGQMGGSGSFSPDSACVQKCAEAGKGCFDQSNGDPAVQQGCQETAKTCMSQCGPTSGPGNGFPGAPNGEMPGSSFGNGMPPGGPNGGRQGGPDEAQIRAMEEAGLKQMKKGVAGFAKQIVKIKARLAVLLKKGVTAPQSLTDALAKADETLAQVRAAATPDDLDMSTVASDLQDVSEVIQEEMPNLERLANLPKIYARIDKQIASFDRMLAADRKLAASSKIDITAAVDDFAAALAGVKANYASIKEKIAAGETDDGFDALQTDVFDSFQDIGALHGRIQQIRQLTQTVRQGDRQIAQYQSQLNRLKRQGKDTAAAQAALDDGKAKLAELKVAAAAKPLDEENVFELLSGLDEARNAFLDELDALTGTATPREVDAGLPQAPSFDNSSFKSFLPPEPPTQSPDLPPAKPTSELPPTGQAAPPAAPIMVQAETGVLGGSKGSMTAIGQTSNMPDTHGGYLYLGDGGATATYAVQTPAAGTHVLWFRFSDDAKHADGARAVNLYANGAKTTWSNQSLDTKGWVYVKFGLVELKAGTNTLVFEKAATTSAAFVMDDFWLSGDLTYQPK